MHVTEATYSVWDTVLNPENNILYVALPTVLLPEASKQSFITLLEFAEEKLDVDAVVLCMRKDRIDRPNLVRTFLFLGFQPLSPKSSLAPPQASEDNNLFLIYKIEDDWVTSESDDDDDDTRSNITVCEVKIDSNHIWK